MSVEAAATPTPAPAQTYSPTMRRAGLCGLAMLWFVVPFASVLAPSSIPLFATIGAALVVLPILVDHVRRGSPRHGLGLDDLGVSLFFVGALIATFGPQAVVDRWVCIHRLAQLAGFAALYYGVLGHVRRDDGSFVRGATRLGAAAVVAQIGFAIFEFVTEDRARLTSTAFNPNFFASFVLAWTVVFVPSWLARKGGIKKTLLVTALLVPLLVATGSKSGVMFFAFLAFVLLVGNTRIGFTRSALLMLVVLAGVFLVPNPLRTRILASTDQVYPRRFYYEIALENFREHPLGIGPGMNKFHFARKAFYEPEPSFLHRRREVGLIHNVMLGAAVETGVIGLIGAILFAGTFVWRGLERRSRVTPRAAGAFAAAGLLLLHMQVDGLSQSAVMMSTWLFFVAIVRAESEARSPARRRFALPRVASAGCGVAVLALSWPVAVTAIESGHLVAGDDAMAAADPRLAFVEYQRAADIAPLDAVPVRKSLEALLYVFDVTLDPALLQRLAVEARRAIELNPLDPEPYLWMARGLSSAHVKLKVPQTAKLLDSAAEQMGIALELDPLDVQTRFGRARTLIYVGRSDEAIEELRRVIAYERNFVQAHIALSALLEERDDFDGAAAEMTEAIRAWHECVEIARTSRYGFVLFFQEQVGRFDPAEAMVEVRRLKNHLHK